MPNVNVFRGSDGVIELAFDQGPEGEMAQKIKDAYNLSPVGRATNVEVKVESELKPFHELGQRYATELRPGNVNVSGMIQRAHINGALLKLLLGTCDPENPTASDQRPAGTWVQPSFDIVLNLANPAVTDVSSTMTIHGVKFENWNYQIPEDDFIMESVSFKALWVSIEDKG